MENLKILPARENFSYHSAGHPTNIPQVHTFHTNRYAYTPSSPLTCSLPA